MSEIKIFGKAPIFVPIRSSWCINRMCSTCSALYQMTYESMKSTHLLTRMHVLVYEVCVACTIIEIHLLGKKYSRNYKNAVIRTDVCQFQWALLTYMSGTRCETIWVKHILYYASAQYGLMIPLYLASLMLVPKCGPK